MAKRANPFIEDYVQQSKIHVSLKQFNNTEDRLQKVYEKTLELLFKGAKKSLPQGVISNENENIINAADKKDKLKQLFIGQNGTLLHCGNKVQNISSAKLCSCGNGNEAQCAYCEVPLCFECQHLCVQCDKAYCKSCTAIAESEGAEICVSCYS